MPPARTGSTGAATGINVPATSLGSTPTPYSRPARTERTHSENQERAYIAASRRSDRSLEARVESARRASEIHKQRTGRALRVTEQDVINEEMYEEEDDDLPHQYRRLTAHLHNNSGDFNRRLSSYLGSHVAIRQALQDAIASSYVQTGQQSPYAQPHMVQQSLAGTPQMQQPDPSVNANAWVSQVASASPLQINMPPHVLARAQTQTNQLRPAPHPAAAHHSRSPSATSAVQSVQESSTPATQMSSPAAPAANRPSQMPMEQRVQSSNKPVPNMLPEQPQQPQPHSDYAHTADHGAFSTTLPTETQLFINRPVETVASTKPSLNLANSAVPNHAGARYAGMTQTLALPELDTDLAQHNSWSEVNSAAALDATFASAGGMFGYGDTTTSLWDEANNNGYVLNDDDWNAFINTSSYEEAAV